MIIDHIGIVVKSIEKSIIKWGDLFGYHQFTEIVENTKQKVKVVFLKKNNSLMIKLIETIDISSPINNYAKKGGGLHHLCFKCDNIQDTIDFLLKNNMRLIKKPEPGEAFENESIAFMYGMNGLNIELIDTHKKAKEIIMIENTKND